MYTLEMTSGREQTPTNQVINNSIIKKHKVLTFSKSGLKLEILKETENYYITNPFLPFNIGIPGKTKRVKWSKDSKRCIDSLEVIRYKKIVELDSEELLNAKHLY